MTDTNDAWLARGARGGNLRDFAALAEMYRPLAHALAFEKSGDLAKSGERLGEFVAQFYRRVVSAEGPEDMPKIAREVAGALAGDGAPAAPTPAEGEGTGDLHSIQMTDKIRTHRALLATVAKLEGRARSLFVLRFLYRLPYREIARLLETPLTETRTALQDLHVRLGADLDRLEREEGIKYGVL